MNVGRNYNGPKVVRVIYYSHKDWDCYRKDKLLNNIIIILFKAASFYSDVIQVRNMAICWEICNLQMVSREVQKL